MCVLRCFEGAEVLARCQRKFGRIDPWLLICFRFRPCEASPNPWPAAEATRQQPFVLTTVGRGGFCSRSGRF